MIEQNDNLTAAILTIPVVRRGDDPEEVVKTYKAIREQLREPEETVAVPKAMKPLLEQALEEKARRQKQGT